MLSRAPLRYRCAARNAAALLSRPTAASPPTSRIAFVRLAHSVPSLGQHDADFKENGVPDLFSKAGFDVAWTGYQTHVLDKLNDNLAGTVRQNYPVQTIAIDTARNPATASTFNYASMAHNNHFFFSTLSPQPTEIPADLKQHLERSFSSIESLQSTFIDTASAMFGPGFVWLVQQRDVSPNHPTSSHQFHLSNDKGLDFRILTTYLAGSPYPAAHWRQQNRDMNTENLESAEDYYRQTTTQNSVGSFGSYSNAQQPAGVQEHDIKRYGGADIVPLLCVSTWEHTWMPDWGVKGKNEYLQQWWNHINWQAVRDNVAWPSARPAGQRF